MRGGKAELRTAQRTILGQAVGAQPRIRGEHVQVVLIHEACSLTLIVVMRRSACRVRGRRGVSRPLPTGIAQNRRCAPGVANYVRLAHPPSAGLLSGGGTCLGSKNSVREPLRVPSQHDWFNIPWQVSVDGVREAKT